jgi:hypothetical protein
MARHSQKRRSKARSQRGGDLGGNPASSWGWGLGTVGGGWTQFMNSLSLQPGQNLGAAQSNNIVPVGNVNAQTSQPGIGPNLTGAVPQSGGKRRRHRHKRSAKRGGNIGAVISQAAVPGILLAAQNMYGKRTRKHRQSRRHRRH